MAFLDLRHILMDMLPSPAIVEQAEVLRIQTQMEEIHRPLWAINAIILDAHLRVMALKEQYLDDWIADVGAAMVDLEDLLASIIDRQERAVESDRSLSHSSSFLLPRLAFRIAILRKLKKMGRRLDGLVKRGAAFNLQREPMNSMDPLQDGYSAILKDEVKGRRVEYEQKIMEHLQQQQRRREEVEMDSTTKEEHSSEEIIEMGMNSTAKEEHSSDNIVEMEMHSTTMEEHSSDEIVETEMHSTTKEEHSSDEIIEMEMHTMRKEEYSSVEMDAPFTIVIEGDEGMGKRTLARMIYHDEWVRQYFHHRFWVDASNFDNGDVVGMGREITRSMGHGNYIEIPPQISSFQEMWLFLSQKLAGRRYLLILDGYDWFSWDDVLQWNTKWNELKRILLRVGGPGSTIIITTNLSYPENAGFELRLEGVSENDWTELFMRWALAYHQRPDQGKPKEEEEDMARTIGMQIYKRNYERHRLAREDDPLSAKLMGSIFRYIEISRWQEIVNFSDLENIVSDRYENLIRFYFHPTRHAHSVFYRSLFPDDDDDIFLSEEFMHLMIVEGILPIWSDKDVRLGYMEMIKNKYGYRSKSVKTQYCFTVNLSKGSLEIPKQCRHLCLLFNSNTSITLFPILAQFERNKLRTLILRCGREDIILNDPKCQIAVPNGMFATLTYLHTLHLQASKIQHLPSTIGRLHNLRYLNLSYTEIHTLPRSLWNLQNLQILNLAHCQNLERLSRWIHKLGRLQILKLTYCEKLRILPATITNLANLQELDLKGCPWLVQLPQCINNLKCLVELNMHNCISLTQMPCGIGALTDLLRLSGYQANDEFGSALKELQSLVNLRELRLEKLEQVWRSKEIVVDLGLQKKTNLKYLTLRWQWWNVDLDSEVGVNLEATSLQELEPLEDDIKLNKADMDDNLEVRVHPKALIEHVQQLEDLQPYQPSLKELEIISYIGNKWPSWMLDVSPFESLVKIRLINLKRCERLPPLEQLNCLQILEISGMNSSVDVVIGDENRDSKLKKLTFSGMPKLENLSIISYGIYLSRELNIIQCPKLIALDNHYFSYKKLKLWLNNEIIFTCEFKGWNNLIRLEELEIVGCQELKFLPHGMKNLSNLCKLTIISCNNLISLPDWMGKSFYQLEFLEICNCSALTSIPTVPKRSLKQMTFQGCPNLQLLSHVPDSPTQITIQGCPKLQLSPMYRRMPISKLR